MTEVFVTELPVSVSVLGEPLAGQVLQVGKGLDPFDLRFQGSRPCTEQGTRLDLWGPFQFCDLLRVRCR